MDTRSNKKGGEKSKYLSTNLIVFSFHGLFAFKNVQVGHQKLFVGVGVLHRFPGQVERLGGDFPDVTRQGVVLVVGLEVPEAGDAVLIENRVVGFHQIGMPEGKRSQN